jgi:glycosyltransferase
MRVLFVTFPWSTHHHAMVPLAWACRVAGHDVRVASTPALHEVITQSGLPAVEVGRDADLAAIATDRRLLTLQPSRWPRDWPIHPERLDDEQVEVAAALGRMQIAIGGVMLDDLLTFARTWRPDLVVHDAVSYAGPVVASALGVPNASHLWGTPGPQRIELRRLDSEPLPEYVELFERARAKVRTEPALWVDPCAPGLRYLVGASCRPVRYIPYNGPGRSPGWLLEEPKRRRICVTWGAATELGAAGVELLRQCVEAAAAADSEVIVAVNASVAELLASRALPGDARVEVGVPLAQLLPGCAAVIHHGGAGTTLTAVVSGTPQLVVALRPEPAINGSRLAAAGAGLDLLTSEVPDGADGTRVLADRVARLVEEPSFGVAAKRLRDGVLGQPTPAQAVPELERLTR